MCRSSRSNGAGPRSFTPRRSRSTSQYIGSPLNACSAEFFRFVLQFLCLKACVHGGSAVPPGGDGGPSLGNRPPGGGGGPCSLGWGRTRGGGGYSESLRQTEGCLCTIVVLQSLVWLWSLLRVYSDSRAVSCCCGTVAASSQKKKSTPSPLHCGRVLIMRLLRSCFGHVFVGATGHPLGRMGYRFIHVPPRCSPSTARKCWAGENFT